MAIDAPAGTERANGLATALNVIISPAEAFEELRVAPTWGWAFLITLVLMLVGTFLALPEQMHAVHATMAAQLAANPNLTDAQRSAQLAVADNFGKFGLVLAPVGLLLVVLLQSVIMLIFNLVGGGSSTFKQLWASAMNIQIPGWGLYSIVVGVLGMVRGPNAYNSTSDLYLTIPSLAWAMPHTVKMTAFFFYFNPFYIWAAILIAMAMQIVARVPKMQAYLTAAAVFFGGALFQMVTAR